MWSTNIIPDGTSLLPVELKCLIATYCEQDSLTKLCLVQREWFSAAERSLYSRVRLEGGDSFASILAVLNVLSSIALNERRAAFISELHVALTARAITTSRCSSCLATSRLSTIRNRCNVRWIQIPSNFGLSDGAMENIVQYQPVDCVTYSVKNDILIWAYIWRVIRKTPNLTKVVLPSREGHSSVARKTIATLAFSLNRLSFVSMPSGIAFDTDCVHNDTLSLCRRLAHGPRSLVLCGFAPRLVTARTLHNSILRIGQEGISLIGMGGGQVQVWLAVYAPGEQSRAYADSIHKFARYASSGPELSHLQLAVRVDQGPELLEILSIMNASSLATRVTRLSISIHPSASLFEATNWRRVPARAAAAGHAPKSDNFVSVIAQMHKLERIVILGLGDVDSTHAWSNALTFRQLQFAAAELGLALPNALKGVELVDST
ncbi:hypothetical protein BKA62DRAFT_705669 [Auriculariales sp. MPI-PUGE-AT-0066]|nr:hypothetical protein BKA62DRAFT_705669 [Auriculariales sp. MPI-PUGE-AT-0066]